MGWHDCVREEVESEREDVRERKVESEGFLICSTWNTKE